MTTPAEAEQLIYKQWLDNWVTGGKIRTPTAFEEEQQPNAVSVGETSWAYVFVQDIGSPQQTLGSMGRRRFLRKAQVVVNLYVPQGQGTKAALDLAQEARTIFEGISLSPLKNFAKSDIVRVGPKPPEYQVSVITPFEYSETK